MAYNKLKNFAKENQWANDYLKEGMIFEAWITYIRENDRDAEKIVLDIDEEMMTQRGQKLLSEEEWESLQIEAMDYSRMRKLEQ